jgi:hypothetical protein
MLINIFEEIPWGKFIQLEQFKKLSLTEQQIYYDQYISDLNVARQNWTAYQNKGPLTSNTPSGPSACNLGMDVIFLLDYSGSMDTVIASLKVQIANIINTIIAESNNNYRLGLILFDEYEQNITVNYTLEPLYTALPADRRLQLPGSGSAQGPIYMYITGLVELDTNNEAAFTTALNKLDTTDFPMQAGTGAPEPGDVGYEYLLDGMVGSFRNDVAKIVILISDALPGGGNEAYDSTTIASLEASKTESIAEGIQVFYLDVNASSPTRNPNEGYRILSDNTQGTYDQSPSGDASVITGSIENLCD